MLKYARYVEMLLKFTLYQIKSLRSKRILRFEQPFILLKLKGFYTGNKTELLLIKIIESIFNQFCSNLRKH